MMPAASQDGEALDGLLARLYEGYRVDLRNYARASLARRVRLAMARSGFHDLTEYSQALLGDAALFDHFVNDVTIQVSELFRDPGFHLLFGEHVLPVLRTYPLLRIWNSGCSAGEEAYSLAILLSEEGLYERTQIYATDLSSRAIARAKQGMFAARHVRRFTSNYQHAGGKASLSDYYTAGYDQLVMREWLRKNILFFRHDLVGDHVFASMHAIFCRNVLIYFDRSLRARVLTKLAGGLVSEGFLCLGTSERLHASSEAQCFQPFREEARIYRVLG
jgi:chemotaxis protein methyltransferase CheR